MPLLPGKANVGRNISELEKSGRGNKQAIAIAMKEAGVSKNQKPRKPKFKRSSGRHYA